MGPRKLGDFMSIDNVQGNIFLRRALSRKWHLVVWLTVLGLALGTASFYLTPRTYTSTATVFLNQLVGNPFSPTTPTSRTEQLAALTTESGVVLTDEVIQGAIASSELSKYTPQMLRSATKATVPSNSQVMDISFSSSSPTEARQVAQALTESFLTFRTNRAQQVVDSQETLLASREQAVGALLDTANKAYDAAKNANAAQASLIDLDQQVRLYAQELASVKVERTTNANSSLDPGSIIGPANEPASPDGINALLIAFMLLVLGAGAGLLCALVAEHADSRIRDTQDLQRHGLPPALGVLAGPMSQGQLKEAALEQYLALVPVLSRLMPMPGSIALVGRQNSEEVHAIAVGISIAFALRGKRVCLVSTSTLSRNYAARPGLSDVLAREISLTDSLKVTDYRLGSVALLPVGTQEESLSVLVQPTVLNELTRELQGDFDLVLYVACETDTVLASTVASCSDQTLMVIPTDKTRAPELSLATDYLSQRGAQIAGCLMYSAPWVLASEKELVEGFESHARFRLHERSSNAS